MLTELRVRNLGVIEELTLLLGPGLTALTGETGAGKTLVVEAIELLVGGRPDAVLVRPGAEEAWVEGRFTVDGDGSASEVVLARAVPAAGRSRAYVDGRMAPVAALAEWAARLVDLHGQHAHQSLLSAAVQRAALDTFGGIDRHPLDAARRELRRLHDALAALGGDARARAREVDLIRFQLAELDAAGLSDAGEEALLEAEEAVLADAAALRDAAVGAYDLIAGDGGATESLAAATAALRGRAGRPEPGPFGAVLARLRDAAAELGDVAADLRASGEAIVDDPERLAAVQDRRHALRALRRKYGDTLADVLAFAGSARDRLAELESFEARSAAIERDLTSAESAVATAAAVVAQRRRQAAPALAGAIETHLHDLALPRARFGVDVDGPPPADDVVFGLGANPGEPILPLTKVASGGELARTMLAARLVLTAGPPTLIFDEVDAGIGGEAAGAVGSALRRLADEPGRQVLVVTHLPQVAAAATCQVAVTKVERGGRTVAEARVVSGDERVRELSRMLSGQPESASARSHAAELLGMAGGDATR